MIVAIPVGASQVQRAIKLLNWCAQLDGGSRHPCLLVLAKEIQDPEIQELLKAAGRAFCNISAVRAVLRSKQVQGEPERILFRTACDYSRKASKILFFWLSLYSVPERSGWMDRIESEIPNTKFNHSGDDVSKYALRSDVIGTREFQLDDSGSVIDKLRKQSEVKIEVVRPTWPEVQNLSSNKFKREPSITIVYIHVPGDEKHWRYAREFVDTYKKFPPLYPHETVIVSQGKGPAPLAKAMFKAVFNPHYFLHDDSGWDIGGYIAASAMEAVRGSDCVLCVGGSAYFQREGWLKRIAEAWHKHGPGFYGSTSTYEVSPHLCTSGFWCAPEIIRAYPVKVTNRETRYDFEHGPNACWKMVAENSLPVKLVTWDGEYDWQEWRKPPNIYRRGDQSNALIHWHHYKEYDKADTKLKVTMASHSDTLTDPHYLSPSVPQTPDSFKAAHGFA